MIAVDDENRFDNDYAPNLPHYSEVAQIRQTLKAWTNDNNVRLFNHKNFFAEGEFKNSTSSKFLAIFLVDLMPQFNFWKPYSDKCVNQGKQIFVITDSFITDLPALPGIHFFPYYKLLGADASYNNYELVDVPKKKLYSCFIQRVESVRQTWLYFLHQKDLLDKGNVCFHMKQLAGYSDLSGIELYDWIHQNYGLDKVPHFHKSYLALRNQIPYLNFVKDADPNQLLMDSKYFLALETYATDDDCGVSGVYEKSLSALQFACFPLLFCQRGTIGLLKSTGLEIPTTLLDLDNLPWQQRQQKLLAILEEDQGEYIWAEYKDRALHNRELITSWQQSYKQPGFFDLTFEKILNS